MDRGQGVWLRGVWLRGVWMGCSRFRQGTGLWLGYRGNSRGTVGVQRDQAGFKGSG